MNRPEPPKHISFPGKIHLIRNDQELQAVDLGAVTEVGFDTETRPSFKKGDVFDVALLQLATDADAYLIRLHYVTQLQGIQKILENADIIKAGVAIVQDLKLLRKKMTFVPRGFVELQTLAKEKGLQNFGLKGMTEEVLQASLSKRSKMTNWENRDLTNEQLMYAATDAWIGLQLYRKLSLKETPT